MHLLGTACAIDDAQDRGYANKMGANGEFVPTTLGVALVDAYNSMPLAFKLSAPQLRAKVPLLTLHVANTWAYYSFPPSST